VSGRSGGEERVLHSKLDIPARLASHSAALARLFYPIFFGLAFHCWLLVVTHQLRQLSDIRQDPSRLDIIADFNHCLDFKMRWQTNVLKCFC
jgi:hypothetical protein